MSSAPMSVISNAFLSTSCLHCGAPVPSSMTTTTGGVLHFCCRGCSIVYELLQARGLNQYYEIRERLQPSQKRTPHFGETADCQFSYLDDPEFLREYSDSSGYEMNFYLEGVHCAACVWLTEKLPHFVPGVESLRLNLSTGVANVRRLPNGSFAQAAEELRRLGYSPHAVKKNENEALQIRENRTHLIRIGVAAMAAGNIMLLAAALYAGADGSLSDAFRWLSLLLYLPVLFFSAAPFFRSAFASLTSKQISMDVPIALGLAVGTIASFYNFFNGSDYVYFDSLSSLVFLLLSTRYLLKKVNQHALKTTEMMHFLAPSRANRWSDKTVQYEEVKTDSLREGDRVRVMPGECFPVDGVVLEGKSAVNRALLTGESTLTKTQKGDWVHAGTLNLYAPLEVEVKNSGISTRLGKILTATEQSLTNKAPIVSFVDRVGQGFIAAVLLLSFVGFLLGLSTSWQEAINRALAIAIVVCPCTFALATPLAISLAISRCARNGVWIKGADIIERLSHARSIFFDKTGTLTEGSLQVTEWLEFEPGAVDALLTLESKSAHPIAKAIVRYFSHSNIKYNSSIEISDFSEIAGKGIKAKSGSSSYEISSFENFENSTKKSNNIETHVILKRDDRIIGKLVLADCLRSESRSAIKKLYQLGLNIFLISGDSSHPVKKTAQDLGIPQEQIFWSATPEKKAETINSKSRSIMVGDGANDAIALAAADVGVAVQGGMEISARAAGVYCTSPGIISIPGLIIVSRETMKIIYRNLIFAILYNLIGIAVAITGHLNPLFAAILMPASALTVYLSTIAGTQGLRHAFDQVAFKEVM